MKLKFCFLFFIIINFIFCKKKHEDKLEDKSSIFAINIGNSEYTKFNIEKRISLLTQNFNLFYTTYQIPVNGWGGSNPIIDKYRNAGVKLLLNITSNLVEDSIFNTKQFYTDTSNYRFVVEDIVNKYKPELLIIEYQEANNYYNKGNINQYFILLNIATEICKKHNIKITNGGIHERLATLLCWNYYYTNGETEKAKIFALKAFPKAYSNDMPLYITNNPSIQQEINKGKILLEAYKKLDFVNIHWNELISQVEKNTQTTELATLNEVDMQTFEECVNYLKNVTSKSIITTEIGQLNSQPNFLKQIVQKTIDLKMPYIIWQSIDNEKGNKALYNKDGILRSNGNALNEVLFSNKDRLKNNF